MLYAFVFEPLFWLVVGPFLVFGAVCAVRVKTVFHAFADKGVRANLSGAQAAAAVLRAGGVSGVGIEEHQGFLSDHYDPRARMLRLSPAVFRGRSVSSIAVAAHEAGHAIQHARAYAPLKMRSALVPVVQFGSQLWSIALVGALFYGLDGWMLDLAIVSFFLTALFQLVTLPVEFDASRRAKAVLATTGIVSTPEEARGVEKVLGAAAMTYVAGLLTAVAQLVVLVLLRSRRD